MTLCKLIDGLYAHQALIMKYKRQALAIAYGEPMRVICGDEQFMEASAGCETVAYLILLPFTNLKTVFNDTKSRITSVHAIAHGVPQCNFQSGPVSLYSGSLVSC